MEGIQKHHQLLNLLNLKKVRDHDHLTCEYRSPAHNECNLQLPHQSEESENSAHHAQPQRYCFYVIAISTIASF